MSLSKTKFKQMLEKEIDPFAREGMEAYWDGQDYCPWNEGTDGEGGWLKGWHACEREDAKQSPNSLYVKILKECWLYVGTPTTYNHRQHGNAVEIDGRMYVGRFSYKTVDVMMKMLQEG